MFKKILLSLVIILAAVLLFGYYYLAHYMPNAPAPPDITVEITDERVERGRYLAHHVSVCMDCHAVRDWSLYSAPPFPESVGAGGDEFTREMGLPGDVYARNLTPTNLADYTDGELFRAITTGVDRHNQVLFPIMPFEQYSKMAEEDVISIIAYLRTLEPKEGEYPSADLDFPLNLIINTLAHTYIGPPSPPDRSDWLKYGEYITTIAACGDCHFPGTLSKIDRTRPFAGGMEFEFPFGIVRPANLTPDRETGIGNWSKEFFIEKFKMHDPEVTPYQPVSPDQYNTVMPWTMYAGMTEEDLGAIYDYLMSLQPIHNPVIKFTPASAQ